MNARDILCINYLETWKGSIVYYDEAIQNNAGRLLDQMIEMKRFDALNQALRMKLIPLSLAGEKADAIRDPFEKAELLELSKQKEEEDLTDLL